MIDGNQHKPLILMVDDVPKNLQLLGIILKKIDCEIAAATDGQQVMDMIAHHKPDLILLDVMMPVLDGYEVCSRLKADPNTTDIPIIFLTAKTESSDIVKGFELGAVDYVTKPFTPAELLARVKTHLELRQSKIALEQNVKELKDALEHVKQLSGLLPICAHCKKIRNDSGYWQQVEVYIENHSEAQFTHGFCPDCIQQYYPEYADPATDSSEHTHENNEKQPSGT